MQQTRITVFIIALICSSLLGSAPVRLGRESTTRIAANAADGKHSIKIGYIVSLSGVGSPYGQAMVNGMNLYLDRIHKEMAGRQVELIVENAESNPATAVAKLRKLVEEDKVDLVAGAALSNVAYGIGKFVDKYQVPFIIAVSAANDLTQRQHPKWLVRTSFSASQPSHALGEYAYKTLGFRRIATIGMDYAYGYETVGGFQKSFEGAGGRVVQKLWAPLGFEDFTGILKHIPKDADAVFMCNSGTAAKLIPEQYKQLGFRLPLLGATTTFDETVLPRLGDEVVGAISSGHYDPGLNSPANKRFVADYRAKYGTDPSMFSESAYTCGMWIDRAIENLKGDLGNKAKLLAALKAVSIDDAPRGPMKLDDYGNPIENIYVRKVVKLNGKLENKIVYTFPMVSQFWTWKAADYLKQPPYSKDYPPCRYCSSSP